MYRSTVLVVYLIMLLICTGAAYDQSDQTVESDAVTLDAVVKPSVQIDQIHIKSLGSDCQMVIMGQANCDVSIDVQVQVTSQVQLINKQTYVVNYQNGGSFLKRIRYPAAGRQSKNLEIIITSLI